MYELMQHLIAFKYACKINHWSTNEYAQHLLYDRLAEGVDEWVDKVAESHFMAGDEKSVFKPDLLTSTMISRNIVGMCESIISHLEELQEDDELNEGAKSLLGDIEAEFLVKLALAKLV